MTLEETLDYLDNRYVPTCLEEAKVVLTLIHHTKVGQNTIDKLQEENTKLKQAYKELKQELINTREAKDDLELGLLLELMDKERATK